MRVLYLTDSLSDLDGVGRYALRLIAALEGLGEGEEGLEGGFRPQIQLARKHRPTSSQVPAHWPIEVALPPDYFFHMARTRFWPSLAAAATRVARAARHCDLVHAIKDYPHSLAGLLGARMARVPCVATAHGTYSVQPLLERRHERLARWTYRNLSAVVPVSGYTQRRLFELLDERDLPRDRVTTIPNAVATEPYARAPELDELGGPRPWHDAPFTLGIGELKERKGHHLALAAWVRAARVRPELQHWIVGKPSDAEYRERLLAIAREGGCLDRVHLLGNVSEAEKIDLLQRAEVFVHTPVTASGGGFEGFGIVYLEAAASGTPSLGTLESGAEDAVVDDVSGLLVAPEVEAVAAGLGRLLSDSDLRTRLAQSARAYAQEQSWDHNARAMLAVYRRALA